MLTKPFSKSMNGFSGRSIAGRDGKYRCRISVNSGGLSCYPFHEGGDGSRSITDSLGILTSPFILL